MGSNVGGWLGAALGAIGLVCVLAIGGWDTSIALPGFGALALYVVGLVVFGRMRFRCPSCGVRSSRASGRVGFREVSRHAHHLPRPGHVNVRGFAVHPRTCSACGVAFVGEAASGRRERLPL